MTFTQGEFLGAAIRDFNGSLGWGSQTSQLTVNLVEDLDQTFSAPPMGSPLTFEYDGWEFAGLLTNLEESRGQDGNRVLRVILTDPRAILDGVQMIIGDYTGGTFSVPNLYNVYGYLEDQNGFGGSQINEAGIPWYLIKNSIVSLVTSSPIVYNNSVYYLDLSELPPVPDHYRISGSNVSVMSFIQDISEVGGADFFVELLVNTIKIKTVSRRNQPTFGKITEFINSTNQGAVSNTTGYEAQFHTTSKFVVGPPTENVYFQSYQDFGNNEDQGFYADDTIWPYWGLNRYGNVIVGEPIAVQEDEEVGETPSTTSDEQPEPNTTKVDTVDHFFIADGTPITYPSLNTDWTGGFPISVNEMRAAVVSQESWEAYLITKDDDEVNPHFKKATRLGIIGNVYKRFLSYLSARTIAAIKGMSPKDGANLSDNIKESLNEVHQAYLLRVYEFVKRYASEFFGKKFMVRIPFVFIKKEPETNRISTSLEVTDSGYLSEDEIEQAVNNNVYPSDVNFITNEQLKTEAYVRFDGWQEEHIDLSSLSDSDYVISNNSVFVKCTVDPNLVYLDSSTGFSPRVVITLPAPVLSATEGYRHAGIIQDALSERLATEGGLESDAVKAATGRILSAVGSETLYLGTAGLPLKPVMAAIPLRDNTTVYGPWYSIGGTGNVEFDQDGNLNPWNFNGYEGMNQAGEAIVSEAYANRQVSESGSVEVPGAPSVRMGRILSAGGPYVTDITVNINDNGVTTNYRMNTWQVKPGKLTRYNLDSIQRVNKVAREQARYVRSFLRRKKPIIDNNVRLGSIKPVNRLRPNTSAHMMMADIIKHEENDKINNNVASSPFYNVMTSLSNSDEYLNKAGVSMDGLFRPFSTRPGTSEMSAYETPASGASTPTVDDLNPYKSGNDIGVIVRGSGLPEGSLASDFFNGQVSEMDNARPVSLRGPLVVTGFGYDKNGFPVPADSGNASEFATGYLQESNTWKTGPVDLRWDDSRKVWTGTGTSLSEVTVTEIMLPNASGEATLEGNTVTITDTLNRNCLLPGEKAMVLPGDNGVYNVVGEYGLTRKGITSVTIPPGEGGSGTFQDGSLGLGPIQLVYDWMDVEGEDDIGANTEVMMQYIPLESKWIITGSACLPSGAV